MVYLPRRKPLRYFYYQIISWAKNTLYIESDPNLLRFYTIYWLAYLAMESIREIFAIRLFTLLFVNIWGRAKMATPLQTTSSNAFSGIKCFNFDYKFTEVCFSGRIDNKLALFQVMAGPEQTKKPYLNQWWLILLTHMRRSASMT